MTANRTVIEKVGDWKVAYDAIRDELTPAAFREITSLAKADDVQSINIGMVASRVVFANDRAAATVASLLVATGIKPVAFNYGDDPE